MPHRGDQYNGQHLFLSAVLIGHAEGVLRAAIKAYEEVEKESMANDSMGNSGSDIDTSPATPVTP